LVADVFDQKDGLLYDEAFKSVPHKQLLSSRQKTSSILEMVRGILFPAMILNYFILSFGFAVHIIASMDFFPSHKGRISHQFSDKKVAEYFGW
jgi:hypothetical protein